MLYWKAQSAFCFLGLWLVNILIDYDVQNKREVSFISNKRRNKQQNPDQVVMKWGK